MSRFPRRSLLKWISGLIASANAAVVGGATTAYVRGSLRRNSPPPASFRRVTRLSDLPPGKPVLVPIMGSRHDAWTLHPNELLGRVWVTRKGAAATDPRHDQITALLSICPHLGCSIQLAADATQYVCPCHRATFDFAGRRVGDKRGTNHAPRGMDPVACRVVQDTTSREWWVEVKYETFEQGLTTSTPVA